MKEQNQFFVPKNKTKKKLTNFILLWTSEYSILFLHLLQYLHVSYIIIMISQEEHNF